MAGYEDQAGDEYYMDDSAWSFEQDLVYALDAGGCHTVNQALAQAIKPIKHHFIGFAEQQVWVDPLGVQTILEPSLYGGSQSLQQSHNPHAVDFESLIRVMAKEHNYNASSQKAKSRLTSREDLASSSSDHSSEQRDDPPPGTAAETVEAGTVRALAEKVEERCRSRAVGPWRVGRGYEGRAPWKTLRFLVQPSQSACGKSWASPGEETRLEPGEKSWRLHGSKVQPPANCGSLLSWDSCESVYTSRRHSWEWLPYDPEAVKLREKDCGKRSIKGKGRWTAFTDSHKRM
ncbi:hypothetical protein NDU88_005511 [Pleurodeles waltl]|uniref:Uncharacterized protein n=1 Tax=Pleurodeles waltl TaxID=8319 RepID=A0AAV7TBT4_PLEWA|nr:hypothetical protein NDU88_005511 [Pleurodeles waltl]